MNLEVLKLLKYFLYPFAIIYGAIIWCRHWLFNNNILKSVSFKIPIICIGNIAAGGTGKTPMTEYLLKIFSAQYNIATLSRGYKRKSKGFLIANNNTKIVDIGDEPMQFFTKFNNTTVAVGEDRKMAIEQLLLLKPNLNLILLDDAFQHRAVKAGLNIVLTAFDNIFYKDFLLPVGYLRDIKVSICRANITVVTKCPINLSIKESQKIISSINQFNTKKVYFSYIKYGLPYHIFNKSKIKINEKLNVLLVCAIANPKSIIDYLSTNFVNYSEINFADHYFFNSNDVAKITKQFNLLKTTNSIILTTEKDAVKLKIFEKELNQYPIYALPIELDFLFNEASTFNLQVENFLRNIN